MGEWKLVEYGERLRNLEAAMNKKDNEIKTLQKQVSYLLEALDLHQEMFTHLQKIMEIANDVTVDYFEKEQKKKIGLPLREFIDDSLAGFTIRILIFEDGKETSNILVEYETSRYIVNHLPDSLIVSDVQVIDEEIYQKRIIVYVNK